jgi:nucleoside-diphosphate-sugar epimerase
MNVFLLGATGYIGTAIDAALKAHGHTVVGAARSDAAKAKLAARGTASVHADASDLRSLEAPTTAADVIVYCVQITDADPYTVDVHALRAFADLVRGTGKAFVYTSGCWVYGNTGDTIATEDAPENPPSLVSRRPELERAALALGAARSIVIRPALVYGEGGGIPAMLASSAREQKAAQIMGDGTNHWSTIAVSDLGELFALAIERGANGRVYNANDEATYTVREIAEAASRGAGAGGAVNAIPRDEVLSMLGPFGEALLLDQRLTSARARAELGWAPKAPSIIEDLEHGSYASGPVSPQIMTE